LIDRGYYLRRPDLISCGRTLIGATPPKGQSLSDQYFADMSSRYLSFINDAEIEMWKLGIPQTTRHREVSAFVVVVNSPQVCLKLFDVCLSGCVCLF
jgi:glutamine synthetase